MAENKNKEFDQCDYSDLCQVLDRCQAEVELDNARDVVGRPGGDETIDGIIKNAKSMGCVRKLKDPRKK